MNRKKTFAASLICALALSFSVPCAVGDTFEERIKRFELFNTCSPMGLFVVDLESSAKKIGLTKEAVQATVESRLRSARLYASEEFKSHLFVEVLVIRNAFSITLRYNKVVYEPVSGESLAAITWIKGGTGVHGDDAGYILSHLSQYMDRFILEYLRVNEDACEKRFSLPKK